MNSALNLVTTSFRKLHNLASRNVLHRSFLMSLLISIFYLFSCSKEKQEPAESIDKCDKVTEVLEYKPYGQQPYEARMKFSYDALGRIEIANGFEAGRGITQYKYYKDRIELTLDFYGNIKTTTYYLDKNNLIVRENEKDTFFFYNKEGFLTSFRMGIGYEDDINNYIEYKIEYENGNLSRVYTVNPDVDFKGLTFTYYDTSAQDIIGYIDPIKFGVLGGTHFISYLISGGYFGKRSKNMLKSAAMIDRDFYVSPNQFKMDQKNRIVEWTEAYKFSYACE